MFKWLSKLADAPGQSTGTETLPKLDLETLQNEEIAIIFKHSRSCPVSWAARTQVRKFTASHSLVPVYTVTIQDDRQLSRRIAEHSGIRHESPQIIAFRRGAVFSSTSHEGVTLEYLTALLASHA